MLTQRSTCSLASGGVESLLGALVSPSVLQEGLNLKSTERVRRTVLFVWHFTGTHSQGVLGLPPGQNLCMRALLWPGCLCLEDCVSAGFSSSTSRNTPGSCLRSPGLLLGWGGGLGPSQLHRMFLPPCSEPPSLCLGVGEDSLLTSRIVGESDDPGTDRHGALLLMPSCPQTRYVL